MNLKHTVVWWDRPADTYLNSHLWDYEPETRRWPMRGSKAARISIPIYGIMNLKRGAVSPGRRRRAISIPIYGIMNLKLSKFS